jgi:hypothetical protein
VRILALDLSLTATGVADETDVSTIRPRTTGMERLKSVREQVLRAVHIDGEWGSYDEFGCSAPLDEDDHADLVVIEGYAFAGGGRKTKGGAGMPSHAHALGELGGVVRLALWEAGVAYVDVAPASLKRYATGKGNAPKAEVMMAAGKRLGYDGHDDNESDALWLWHMAMDAYGCVVVKMPETHRVALAAVKWPELSAAVSA